VHGIDDRLMPVGNGMRLARLIPGARYVELPDTGHILPMEAPDAVAEILYSS
jgi:pimeloyl-ACP methyl ester carboxylesterase